MYPMKLWLPFQLLHMDTPIQNGITLDLFVQQKKKLHKLLLHHQLHHHQCHLFSHNFLIASSFPLSFFNVVRKLSFSVWLLMIQYQALWDFYDVIVNSNTFFWLGCSRIFWWTIRKKHAFSWKIICNNNNIIISTSTILHYYPIHILTITMWEKYEEREQALSKADIIGLIFDTLDESKRYMKHLEHVILNWIAIARPYGIWIDCTLR